MRHGFPFDVNSADWTNFCALSARSARAGITPVFVKIHYDLRVFSSQLQIQRVNALYLIADP
jgi:hypothetical protein